MKQLRCYSLISKPAQQLQNICKMNESKIQIQDLKDNVDESKVYR